MIDYEGTIYSGIRIKNGTLFSPQIDEGDSIKPCLFHPDTGAKIEGKIPHWGFIVKKIVEVSNYLSNTPYLTYDIVVTDEGI